MDKHDVLAAVHKVQNRLCGVAAWKKTNQSIICVAKIWFSNVGSVSGKTLKKKKKTAHYYVNYFKQVDFFPASCHYHSSLLMYLFLKHPARHIPFQNKVKEQESSH